MTGTVEINGKILHPIKEAAQAVSYSRDYITRLAREEKIIASLIGRQWFVDLDSLQHYIEATTLEQEVRKKQLSAERKRERQVREVTQEQHTLRLKKAQTLHVRAAVVAALVLGSGLVGGFALHQQILSAKSPATQVANTHTTQTQPSSVNTPAAVVASDSEEPELQIDDNETPEPQLTQELRPLGDIQNGILLFPNDGSTTTVAELFSDKVVVRKLSDGTEVVVRVDEFGEVIGNPVPFVAVPVEHEEI